MKWDVGGIVVAICDSFVINTNQSFLADQSVWLLIDQLEDVGGGGPAGYGNIFPTFSLQFASNKILKYQ